VRAGGTFKVTLSATVPDGWKLYSLKPAEGGPVATSITTGDSAFAIDSISAPKPESYPDRNFGIFTEIYTAETAFQLAVRVRRTAKIGAAELPLLVRFQTCTNRYCLPPRTDTLTIALKVLAPSAVASSVPSSRFPVPAVAVAVPPPAPLVMVAPTDLGSLARFLWLAVTMGLLSLLTPCILPMVPITVAYFSNRSAGGGASRTSAIAHALGIVGAFTLIGVAVSAFLGAGGVVRLAANPVLNLAIAALFIAFALNLVGAFEITLPQSVLTRASALGGKSHAMGALLMGVGFAVTSFTCTVPFVGTLLALASNGSTLWPAVGLAAYGSAFAAPFFALAIAPSLLERLPKPGDWMVSVKRSLALVEIALAVKFISNADLVLNTGVLSRETVIGLWMMAAGGIGFIWLLRARAPGGVSRAPALAAVVLALGATTWLSLGLRGRRIGELEAYLPPIRATKLAHGVELPWLLNDYAGAVKLARDSGRHVLIDFTGYTCTNCRWMEANMFPRPEIAAQLDRFVRVRLFTDGLGEPYATQQRLQLDRFGTVALPYYAVVDASDATIATFLGMTRDPKEFASFLTQSVKGFKSGELR